MRCADRTPKFDLRPIAPGLCTGLPGALDSCEVCARLIFGAIRRESDMSHELFWLVMTTAMTGLMWVPYILDRTMVRGMMGAMGNPSPTDKPQSPWAQRLMAAHVNAVENLVIFAPLVLAAQDLNVNLATPTT